MNRFRYLILCVCLFSCWQVKAQYDAHFSHYWALQPYSNPASIGLAGKLNIAGTYCAQLTGFTRSAKTMYFAADMPFVFLNECHNVGLGFYNETIGLFTNQRISLQYAFRYRLWGGRLAGGVQIGMLSEKFDGGKVDFGDAEGAVESDPAFPSSEVDGTGVDIGVGVHYWNPKFYVGMSVSHLNSPKIMLGEINEFKIDPTYYLTGGCNIPLKNPLLSIQPTLMAQTDGTAYRVDITGRLIYSYDEKKYYGGIGYTPAISCTVLLGAIFQGIHFGYAYELFTNQIGVGNGNHSLMVGYQMDLDFFKKGKNMHKSVRIL